MGNTDTKHHHRPILIHDRLKVIPLPSRAAIIEQVL
jgi:hypothetical protein